MMFLAFVTLVSPLDAAVDSLEATAHEKALLRSIAAHESSGRIEVWTCRVFGDGGRARGAWQVQPRTAAEFAASCSNYNDQAALAVARVRESLSACAHLPEPERLSLYTSGSCERGHVASRARWVSP